MPAGNMTVSPIVKTLAFSLHLLSHHFSSLYNSCTCEVFVIVLTKKNIFLVENVDTDITEFYNCKNWGRSMVEILTVLHGHNKYYFDFGKGTNFFFYSLVL